MTIQDIANLTGVSTATVSRAINKTGYVKEETRRRIFEVIDKHKYVPNAVARSLSINDTSCVGVIIPDIENEFFSKVMSGIAEVAEENGYHILFLGSNESLKREHSFLNIVEAQRLAGVIITPVSEEDVFTKDRLLRFKQRGMSVVLVDRDVPGSNIDGVFSDNVTAARDGVSKLIEAGHTKIATISGPETSKPGKERLLGYIQAMEGAGLYIPPQYVTHGDFRKQRAFECAKSLLSLNEPPTAIFTSNNLTTLGCLEYLTSNKMKIGRDISILGFDDIEALKAINYKLSVIDRDMNQIGREAMRLLLKNLNKRHVKNRERESIVLPCTLILRGAKKMRLKGRS